MMISKVNWNRGSNKTFRSDSGYLEQTGSLFPAKYIVNIYFITVIFDAILYSHRMSFEEAIGAVLFIILK